jgi:hypothetical protein
MPNESRYFKTPRWEHNSTKLVVDLNSNMSMNTSRFEANCTEEQPCDNLPDSVIQFETSENCTPYTFAKRDIAVIPTPLQGLVVYRVGPTQVLVVGGSLEATARTLDDFRAATAAPGWSEGNKRNWTIVVFGETHCSTCAEPEDGYALIYQKLREDLHEALIRVADVVIFRGDGYERTWPVSAGDQCRVPHLDRCGPVYVSGGQMRDRSRLFAQSETAIRSGQSGFGEINANQTHLLYTQFNSLGEEVDQFSVHREAHGEPFLVTIGWIFFGIAVILINILAISKIYMDGAGRRAQSPSFLLSWSAQQGGRSSNDEHDDGGL